MSLPLRSATLYALLGLLSITLPATQFLKALGAECY